ncbi:ATP-dependent helicase [Cryptosporangium minutisporangium]|uniref:DNA 3'-5' helicase n=1 Tax=Cryptosporangium minutisporangium TaxID=113569 RepID=A0ABP6SYM3_9ACTN
MTQLNIEKPIDLLRRLPIDREVLLIAPAGCGKTQALATRAAALIQQGSVRSPRRLLALTYSNKARDNLRVRLRSELPASAQQLVQVSTLHGFAGRVTAAHGRCLGLDMTRTLPEQGALRRLRRDAGISYQNSDYVDGILTRHKRNAGIDDQALLDALADSGCREAVAYEQALRAEGRVDFDDMLRYGARLLKLERVARLYRQHFAGALVDEVQDLSLLQLEMIESIGERRVTYAGDPEQGIYAFAGAEPASIFRRLREREPELVPLTVSYRSSPAVLRAVNALASGTGAPVLTCHDSTKWAEDCAFASLVSTNEDAEARHLLRFIRDYMHGYPERSIGILTRGNRRLSYLLPVLTHAGLTFQDWSVPTHVPSVMALLRRHAAAACADPGSPTTHGERLVELCTADAALGDVTTHDEVRSAVDILLDQVTPGVPLSQVVARMPTPQQPDRPVAPGLHVLTGHAGKGQEFDLVIIVGLEDGKIPDFRATTSVAIAEERRVLHVMLSRAKHSLLITRIENETRTPRWVAPAKRSPWWDLLAEVATEIGARPAR